MNHNPDIFYRSSCNDVEFNDYLLLGGGTDISPKIYGEKNFGLSQSPDTYRDQDNIKSIHEYVELGLPIFGICRGMQLLDAVFGGKLIQHTVGHPQGVTVTTAQFCEKGDNRIIDHNKNCHHQVVDTEHTKGHIIGWSAYSFQGYFGLDESDKLWLDVVPQIMYWPEKKALAVQFHPEWQSHKHEMNVYLRGLIKDLLGLENVL